MQESADLRLVLDSVPAVTQILDQDNQVYLYDRDKGFFIFDYYGGWKNRLPLLQWEHIAISGKTLYGFSGRKMYSYALGTLDLQSFELPQSLGIFNPFASIMVKSIYSNKAEWTYTRYVSLY